MREVRLEPWALGVRLRDEPEGARQYAVSPGSAADGTGVDELAPDHELWIAMAVRDGALLQIRGDTALRAGDQVIVLAPDEEWDPGALFVGSLDRPAAEPG